MRQRRFAAAGRGGYCAGMPDPVAHASFLPPVLIFCAAAVIAVPLFRRLGLSGVLGYLAAGIVIGPSGLSLIGEPETVRGVAELGVVLLLFIVGLELKLSRLISMRRDIFGLGAAQLGVTVAVFAAAAVASGLVLRSAVVVGIVLALSATSIALQMLEERGDLQASYGQRSFAILLFQDLSIAPILALMPLLATAGVFREHGASVDMLIGIATALAALAAVVLVGRYGLNPFFQLLASSGAREVMTASALLVVLGAALVMDKAGLSMAMGAFLAGVLLAEFELPPSARGRHRAVPRHAARALLHERRHVDRRRRRAGALALARRRDARDGCRQGGDRRLPAQDLRLAPLGRGPRRCAPRDRW